MSKVIGIKKKSEHNIIFNYPDLDKKQSLKRAKAEIKRLTKLMDSWTFKIK